MNPLYGPDNLPPDQLIINVTDDHIAHGTKQDCTECAAGLALQEQYPIEDLCWWSITDEHGVVLNSGGNLKRWAMTLELFRFIDTFDMGLPVEPATFVLEADK